MGFSLSKGALTVAVLLSLAACTSAPTWHQQLVAPSSSALSPTPAQVGSPGVVSPSSTRNSTRASSTPQSSGIHSPVPTAAKPTSAPLAAGLPLAYPTESATRVITVVAPSASSTVATLQGFDKVGASWRPRGPAVSAYLGSGGLSSRPSESLSATPMGSFTLTEAFGRNSNPGTSLPYRQTTPADWWISQPGPLYNTLQRCTGSCGFIQGDPNEHLYNITPFYNYAVVIDYNRAPVIQGAGSAFFLHVAVGEPTAGCVAIPQDALTSILGWLTPAAHPRILIGVDTRH